KPALSADQIRVILDNVPLLWKAFFLCLALTNLRIGELLALQWTDIDWNDRKLRMSKSVYRGKLLNSTKTDAELIKHLPETLFRVLEWHRQRSVRIFAHQIAPQTLVGCPRRDRRRDESF